MNMVLWTKLTLVTLKMKQPKQSCPLVKGL